ncbi:hypothetical protein AJ80_07437 [Polytolypa hystricis UAMH7299]|uniref:Uncharacterized protein n=1 Tax=Polytolypa hystricis (strain UAMH7299) TaxID=1447883 RepID=A0A2B7XPH5_POLH7|nr:hypothetical protein AJ80_07437 [Polytolypa hystricis UAMH7299]
MAIVIAVYFIVTRIVLALVSGSDCEATVEVEGGDRDGDRDGDGDGEGGDGPGRFRQVSH